MTIAQCKAGRRKFLLDPRYKGQLRDSTVMAKRLALQIAKEKAMKSRKGMKRK